MKTVFKCEFCNHTVEVNIPDAVDIMNTHEAKCFLNPVSQNCYTCKHHYYGHEGYTECSKHDYDHYFDVSEGDKVCEDYEFEGNK